MFAETLYMSDFVIEKKAVKGKAGKPLKYPFDKLEKGQSFIVPDTEISNISPSARAYGKRHKKQFSCNSEGKNVRVSRIK